jgi:hypothetical protein
VSRAARASPALAALLLGLAGVDCASGAGAGAYRPSRADYERFRERHPGLVEPNYLPFMAWRVRAAGEEGLIFCRWPREAFPLAVHLRAPEIAEELQDEFHPMAPEVFVAAARRALRSWQAELEGLVSFRLADEGEAPDLELRLIAEEAPVPDEGVKVLGQTPLGDACRVSRGFGLGERLRRLGRGARGPDLPEALPVHYAVPELRVYIADEFGLLNPDQVERIALHEIGHALGMRAHSPVPNDLMFETVRESPGRATLSAQDVNSFVTLYGLPNGTVYRRFPGSGEGASPAPRPPEGPARLSLAPHVDARRGFEIQLPEGWLTVDTPTGFVAVDGTTWDYGASLQLIVRRFPSVEAYLERHVQGHVRDGTVLEQGFTAVAGRPAFRLVVRSAGGDLVDENTIVDAGDGRVFVAIADCAPEACAAYRPWFAAALASLEIWGPELRTGREYRGDP